MNAAEIDLAPLNRAIGRLDEGLTLLGGEPENSLLRDGVIQRFEFTYELSHRTLRRFLEATAANPQEIATLSFQDLIRVGNEQGLLQSDWPVWRVYRQARTDTSHTYDEAKAQQVLTIVPPFLDEIRALAESLETRLRA